MPISTSILGTVYLIIDAPGSRALPYYMTRIPRIVVPGIPHHVTQRGNRRQDVFFSDDDYRTYKALLGEWSEKAGLAIWAYCLMPNHVHLICVPKTEDGLRAGIAEAHRRYTRHINARHEWVGHLWQERFHSYPMDEAHLHAAARYVELNPVTAGLVDAARDWPWSSARAHLDGEDDGLVKAGPLLERFGDWHAYLARSLDPEMAEALERHQRTGRPLGDEAFVERLEAATGRSLKPARRGPKPGTERKADKVRKQT